MSSRYGRFRLSHSVSYVPLARVCMRPQCSKCLRSFASEIDCIKDNNVHQRKEFKMRLCVCYSSFTLLFLCDSARSGHGFYCTECMCVCEWVSAVLCCVSVFVLFFALRLCIHFPFVGKERKKNKFLFASSLFAYGLAYGWSFISLLLSRFLFLSLGNTFI